MRAAVATWFTRPTTTMLTVLVAISAAFSVLSPRTFFTLGNAQGMLSDVAVLLVLSIGATFVIITSGIDLSVGSVLVFAAVVGARAMEWAGGSSVATIGLGLVVRVLAGAAWGLVNGLLVSRAAVPPFIVTLGSLGAAYGLALVVSNGIDVRSVPAPLVTFGNSRWLGIPVLAVVATLLTVAAGIVLSQTVFGRHVYAVGANAESARRAGIDVRSRITAVYTLAGALAGTGGFLSLARFGTTTISGNLQTNLQVITAVVIGGTSLFGGTGWMLGTTVGVFIPIVLTNGFIVQGVVPYWQYVAVGVVLILAVLVDQRRRRRPSS